MTLCFKWHGVAFCFNKRHCVSTDDVTFQHMTMCFIVFQQMTVCFEWHCVSTKDIVVKRMRPCCNRWYVLHCAPLCFMVFQQTILRFIVFQQITLCVQQKWHYASTNDIVVQHLTLCFNKWYVSHRVSLCFSNWHCVSSCSKNDIVLQQMTLCPNEWHRVSLCFIVFQQVTLCFNKWHRVSECFTALQQMTLCFNEQRCVS